MTEVAIPLAALGGVGYGLIAARVMLVSWRTEVRIGRNSKLVALLCGSFWPGTATIIGLVTLLTGGAGIFDSGYDSNGKP